MVPAPSELLCVVTRLWGHWCSERLLLTPYDNLGKNKHALSSGVFSFVNRGICLAHLDSA